MSALKFVLFVLQGITSKYFVLSVEDKIFMAWEQDVTRCSAGQKETRTGLSILFGETKQKTNKSHLRWGRIFILPWLGLHICCFLGGPNFGRI